MKEKARNRKRLLLFDIGTTIRATDWFLKIKYTPSSLQLKAVLTKLCSTDKHAIVMCLLERFLFPGKSLQKHTCDFFFIIFSFQEAVNHISLLLFCSIFLPIQPISLSYGQLKASVLTMKQHIFFATSHHELECKIMLNIVHNCITLHNCLQYFYLDKIHCFSAWIDTFHLNWKKKKNSY